MARRRLAAGLGALFIALGAWQFAEAGYIHAKAWLGQALIDGAWARTLDGEHRAKPWPWADTWPVARITVPTHGKRITALAGGSGRTLAWGPGHVDGSVLPGQPGTAIIGGHRDTHFRLLERLKPGDVIRAEDRWGVRHRFRVTAKQVVDSRITRLDPDGVTPALILVTCYPFDAIVPGGPLRYLVFAEADPAPSRPGTDPLPTSSAPHRTDRDPPSKGTIPGSGLSPSVSLSP
jgi:sortase A